MDHAPLNEQVLFSYITAWIRNLINKPTIDLNMPEHNCHLEAPYSTRYTLTEVNFYLFHITDLWF